MRNAWIIALAGLALAVGSYFAIYHTTLSCCGPAAASAPAELVWLRDEFHLSDAEFQRVTELHDAYLPACQERCARIDARNAEARMLFAQTGSVTPEVERALAEAAKVRSECQTGMLRHFVEVSRAMPSEQGKRYLEWVFARTFASAHEAMAASASTPGQGHAHHGQ